MDDKIDAFENFDVNIIIV